MRLFSSAGWYYIIPAALLWIKHFECTFLRHISTDAISDGLEWKLRLFSFRGTGTQGTKQPYTKKLGQNFGAGISSQELCQDDILMTSSYRQNCLWPELLRNGARHPSVYNEQHGVSFGGDRTQISREGGTGPWNMVDSFTLFTECEWGAV